MTVILEPVPSYCLPPAFSKDAPVIASIIAQAFEGYRGQLTPPSSSLSKTPEAVEKELAAAEAILALEDEAPVGCVFFGAEKDAIYLSRLAVLPEYRGKGLAKRLMAAAEEEARRAEANKVWLSVRSVLKELRAFYEGLGYAPESYGTHEGFDEPTFVNLAKHL